MSTIRQVGIMDCARDQLCRDYKLCLAMGVYRAVEFHKNGVDEDMRDRWQSLLMRFIAALRDRDPF